MAWLNSTGWLGPELDDVDEAPPPDAPPEPRPVEVLFDWVELDWLCPLDSFAYNAKRSILNLDTSIFIM